MDGCGLDFTVLTGVHYVEMGKEQKEQPKIVINEMPTKEELEDFIRKMFGFDPKYGGPVVFDIRTGKFKRL